MCGICGVCEYGAVRGNVEPALITAMRDVMTHRGPDDAGELVFDDGRGGLGFRRLSIIDLSAAAHQPMHGCTDSVWLVFNGEIYNHASLRKGLEERCHVYSSRTDSELPSRTMAKRNPSFPRVGLSLVQLLAIFAGPLSPYTREKMRRIC